MEYKKRKKIYRVCLFSALIISILIICGVMYTDLYRETPNLITLKAGIDQDIDINAPLSGKIYENLSSNDIAVTSNSLSVDFSKPVTIHTTKANSYVAKVKLFGLIPFKDIQIEVIDDIRLIPAGISIGIYVETDGVLIVDTATYEGMDGSEQAPSEGILKSGDYVLSINGIEVENKNDFIKEVENSNGNEIVLRIKRNEQVFDVRILPSMNSSGEYKIGAWVRDSAQGIGTLTYVGEDQTFGALGHGINDSDTGTLMELKTGQLYKTEIVDIKKGEDGIPGELTGVIRYTQSNIIGTIEYNTDIGIYGHLNTETANSLTMEALPIATKAEIQIGPAQILCAVSGEPKLYDIEITSINDDKNVNRELSIEVTDPELIELTGGIVQGMSGSPIIQNNRLIGAVTHALVKNATKGYGICIENMLIMR